jgi:hypothetical protein
LQTCAPQAAKEKAQDQMSEFNPNSTDAMFSKVLTRLDQQDEANRATSASFLLVLSEIRDEAKKTNGRVTLLERWRENVTAKTAVIAAGLSFAVTLAVSIAIKYFKV